MWSSSPAASHHFVPRGSSRRVPKKRSAFNCTMEPSCLFPEMYAASGTWSHTTHAVQAFSGVYEGFADWEGNRNTSTTGFSTQAQPYLGSYNVLCSVYIPNAIPHVDQCSCDADIANVFSAKLEDLQVHLTLIFVIYWRLSSSDLPATRVWHNHSPSFLLPCCLRKPNTKAGKILLIALALTLSEGPQICVYHLLMLQAGHVHSPVTLRMV